MNIILKFVTSYIRNRMSHDSDLARSEIFKAINVGMAEAYREDNISTRIASTCQWLVESDPEIKAMYARCPSCMEVVGSAAKEGIIEADIYNY